ncbi:transcriptional regulator, TetR family [Rathayibacter oskolensis]|uniref:Transcriptional regulator, TetR family n=1 Tax=Rathayibacter oskolensis TaxID=1891671 RepID=A0A1X7MU34_9MICO|nr:TetR/AcrR family transcriptional regulator [Rathayibacter oskolensis]SMH28261.1 transcriptional regulator, TetR family [Rathayibacter oskolensis]
MTPVRSDAERSRARILTAARTHAADDLRLNEIAREAGVGVATVYRHFPTVHSLVEALTLGTVERMLALSQQAADDPDPGAAFSTYLRSALALHLEDDGLQRILLADRDEDPAIHAVKVEIVAAASRLLARAQDAGDVRADLTLEQLEHLVCGIELALRLGVPDDRELFTEVLFAGIRARPSDC